MKASEALGLYCKGMPLVRANLEGVNLEGAILQGANLKGANLERANLQRANLEGANLQGANLQWAILCDCNLEGAYVSFRGNAVKIHFEPVSQ